MNTMPLLTRQLFLPRLLYVLSALSTALAPKGIQNPPATSTFTSTSLTLACDRAEVPIISVCGPSLYPGGYRSRRPVFGPLATNGIRLKRRHSHGGVIGKMKAREKQNRGQPLTCIKALRMSVHSTFIIISKPELMILKACFGRNTFVCPGA